MNEPQGGEYAAKILFKILLMKGLPIAVEMLASMP